MKHILDRNLRYVYKPTNVGLDVFCLGRRGQFCGVNPWTTTLMVLHPSVWRVNRPENSEMLDGRGHRAWRSSVTTVCTPNK